MEQSQTVKAYTSLSVKYLTYTPDYHIEKGTISLQHFLLPQMLQTTQDKSTFYIYMALFSLLSLQ